MPRRIVLVGSGASAVHFAQSALEHGHEVLMLDVGREKPAPVRPDATFRQLKEELPDPERYFLGDAFEAVLYPGGGAEYYGFPPSKTYVFEGVPSFRWRSEGFAPLASFALGGLAEAWTGGAYPFNDDELEAFPVRYGELAPYYDLVARRIGISGAADDLARFMPVHEHLLPPIDLDEHSKVLMDRYGQVRERVNRRLGAYLGRSRVAVISRDREGRRACGYLGRCLWGCPSRSLYTPAMTIDECLKFPGFQYRSGVYVRHFKVDRGRRAAAVVAEAIGSGTVEDIAVPDALVLAAGTLSSCRILLESVYRATGERITLRGLMDNRQVLMPFVNLAMLRRQFNPDSYQYHLLGLGLEGSPRREYVHGQITTLKTALIHPILQRIPLDTKTSLSLFRNLHAALGLVNINLHDTRRDDNWATLEPVANAPSKLVIHYASGAAQAEQMRAAMRRVRRILWALNCMVPPGMAHVRPMGASVHYSGLVPMSEQPAAWTTTKDGQSREFDNVYFADGTTFPFLPAKNLTFTLMANAARVADRAFGERQGDPASLR